jgi:hypothetical protein
MLEFDKRRLIMAYNMMDLSTLGPMIAAFFAVFMAMLLVVYIYTAWALMTIANKTRTKYAWLAWIPVANLYLMTQIGKTPWWTLLLLLLYWVPVLGTILTIGLTIYWWWNIAEVRKMPGWLGILMAVPVVNLFVIGYIAWAK